MKFGRILHQGKEKYGIVESGKWYSLVGINRNNLGEENLEALSNISIDLDQPTFDLADEEFSWLPPIAKPGKILCVGRNYAEHSTEQGKDPEKKPIIFSKFSSCIEGHQSKIVKPTNAEFLDYEVELAVIIGKSTLAMTMNDDPLDFVFGYTVANDLTARDIQKSEKQWTRGKGFDQSLPIGPTIVTSDEIRDPKNNDIWLQVNGENRQLSNTSLMIFDVPFLIRYISELITLMPGDIILTGTPAGVGYFMDPPRSLQSGDEVSCGITNIGELRFTIQ
ncbi:MAG: fumarylacetoacetate hydrolase family protein [Candidatus Heimdallarchaeota archaeon]|nr:fumarylacetoacetate hydrolase family protein [Candidatus Heimdallarchaeota archaeon]